MVDIDLMSSVAAIKDLFVMVESVLLQSQVKFSGIYEVVENNEIEFSIKGDYQTKKIMITYLTMVYM